MMRVWLRGKGRNGLIFALVALMSLALVAVACGDDDDDGDKATPTTAAATKTATAAGGAATATKTATAAGGAATATKTATAAGSPAAGGAAAATTIKVEMKDNSFDPKSINAPVGKEVTFDLENEGKAIHNMSVKIDGKDVVSSPESQKAGQKGTLKVTFAKAGTYDFKCDFHPTEMTGKITAK